MTTRRPDLTDLNDLTTWVGELADEYVRQVRAAIDVTFSTQTPRPAGEAVTPGTGAEGSLVPGVANADRSALSVTRGRATTGPTAMAGDEVAGSDAGPPWRAGPAADPSHDSTGPA